ncbi:hypothetical protein NMY22_g1969 [Coprinellus aureogranulatus]|nr:hypothetical protein NMY22_g1969 [Coprinellus aureogranulatus]
MDDPQAWAQAIEGFNTRVGGLFDTIRATDLNNRDEVVNMLFNISQQIPCYHSLLKRLPCAYAQSQATLTNVGCKNPGTMACGAFCKSPLRADKLSPCWKGTGRPPNLTRGAYDGGSKLWNTQPPVDLLNLKDNENDLKKDFNLALLASGDLRDVMKTVNSLPPTFSGKLNIVLNDPDPNVAIRNILILLVLGRHEDIDQGVDMALHTWFSLRIPDEYIIKLCGFAETFKEHIRKTDSAVPYPLDGGKSSVVVDASASSLKTCSSLSMGSSLDLLNSRLPEITARSRMQPMQEEYERVRTNPARNDFWDWTYAFLNPSHRVAMHTYRRFGLVLPFGAANAHFLSPNLSLFSEDGKWLQTDSVTPLQGWNIPEVVECGKAHGAQHEDIFGCLYFYLSSQLRKFAQRIRTWDILFTVFSLDPEQLSQRLRGNAFQQMSLPSTMRFDRIDIGNLVDKQGKLKSLLTAWAPLLRQSEYAVVVGRFENWGKVQGNGKSGSDVGAAAVAKLKGHTEHLLPDSSWDVIGGSSAAIHTLKTNANIVHDHSNEFTQFLKKLKLGQVLQATKLRLRDSHRLVAHRLGAAVNAPPSDVPRFANDDEWYYHSKLIQYNWMTRFIELELDHEFDATAEASNVGKAETEKDKELLAGMALLLAQLAVGR